MKQYGTPCACICFLPPPLPSLFRKTTTPNAQSRPILHTDKVGTPGHETYLDQIGLIGREKNPLIGGLKSETDAAYVLGED